MVYCLPPKADQTLKDIKGKESAMSRTSSNNVKTEAQLLFAGLTGRVEGRAAQL